MSHFEQTRRFTCKNDINKAYLGTCYCYLGVFWAYRSIGCWKQINLPQLGGILRKIFRKKCTFCAETFVCVQKLRKLDYHGDLTRLLICNCRLDIAYCLLRIALLPIALFGCIRRPGCILPLNAYCLRMHTASECIRLPNAFGRRMHSAADAFGGPPGVAPPPSAAEYIQRPNAFRGSIHSEAVCIRMQYASKQDCMHPNRQQAICNRQQAILHLNTDLFNYIRLLYYIRLLIISAYCLLPIARCIRSPNAFGGRCSRRPNAQAWHRQQAIGNR